MYNTLTTIARSYSLEYGSSMAHLHSLIYLSISLVAFICIHVF